MARDACQAVTQYTSGLSQIHTSFQVAASGLRSHSEHLKAESDLHRIEVVARQFQDWADAFNLDLISSPFAWLKYSCLSPCEKNFAPDPECLTTVQALIVPPTIEEQPMAYLADEHGVEIVEYPANQPYGYNSCTTKPYVSHGFAPIGGRRLVRVGTSPSTTETQICVAKNTWKTEAPSTTDREQWQRAGAHLKRAQGAMAGQHYQNLAIDTSAHRDEYSICRTGFAAFSLTDLQGHNFAEMLLTGSETCNRTQKCLNRPEDRLSQEQKENGVEYLTVDVGADHCLSAIFRSGFVTGTVDCNAIAGAWTLYCSHCSPPLVTSQFCQKK